MVEMLVKALYCDGGDDVTLGTTKTGYVEFDSLD